jgi:LytS/YehU family sensor histidine kinase
VTVRIVVELAQDVLTLRVQNTVTPAKPAGGPGIGLKNVRERLAVQFEGRASLTAASAGGEWISEIMMPAKYEFLARSA